jgi:hypothetical protein
MEALRWSRPRLIPVAITGSMSNDGSKASHDASPRNGRSIDFSRLIVLCLIVGVAFVAVGAGLPWLKAVTPRWLALGAAIGFLWAVMGVYWLAWPLVIVAGLWSPLAIAHARRRGDRAALVRAMRWLLLAATCLVALAITELVSATAIQWSYRIASLPTRFPAPAGDGLYVVVVGESSARGEPYQPWVSVGQIVGWQLESTFPGRSIAVDVRAKGGATLEQAVPLLADLKRRPDAIILFSGHNEFQTRFGWSRNVRHYVEEGPKSPLALLELARSISWAANLISRTLDNYYGEAPPPPGVTRELVDHPICTAEEHEDSRQDFERRLDALVAYCGSIKALPILIVPGSNDGSFEPNRSVLAGSTPEPVRAEFARALMAARAAESSDSTAAIAAYRGLVAQHPEFAESHFRLGRLLAESGAWNEANEHFIAARDLDGSPIRCPSDFRQVFRTIARRRSALVIDGPALLSGLSRHGILDQDLYHDAHHLTLIGTIALAQDILRQLKARRAFGWPESMPLREIELADCARHFKLDAETWIKVCERSAEWFTNTANLRYDPAARTEESARYRGAARALAAHQLLPAKLPGSLVPLVPILKTVEAQAER